MLKTGITGGIGSGKSLISKIFAQLGVPVYDADSRARQLMHEDVIRKPLIKAFGTEAYRPDGTLDRAWLASKVFNDTERLAQLNSIVHPAVFKDYDDWAAAHASYPYTLKEAALLFESGSYKSLDKVITVSAPEELRILRTMKRDGISRGEVISRMKNQLSEKERLERADFVIYNDDVQMVLPQVLKLHQLFMATGG